MTPKERELQEAIIRIGTRVLNYFLAPKPTIKKRILPKPKIKKRSSALRLKPKINEKEKRMIAYMKI